jgi:pimeloyl-ACP methyl ester carboxylesterase
MKKTTLLLIAAALAGGVRVSAATMEPINYRHHIIAVDKDGSALMPTVTKTNGKYSARFERIDGEDTRDIKNIGKLRTPYSMYLDEMFDDIARRHPRQVVIYVHGGMNFIAGAAEKSAQMADELVPQGIYPICICWNSNLFDTYGAHLFEVRNGISRPLRAILTSPAALLADFGSSAARAPYTLLNLFSNDAIALDSRFDDRFARTEARFAELKREHKLHPAESVVVSRSKNDRKHRKDAATYDFASYLATLGGKVATAPVIDGLGSPAWNNMLRRTRTMFEREAAFVAHVPEQAGASAPAAHLTGAEDPAFVSREQVKREGQLLYAGREGAVRMFFRRAQERLGLTQRRPFERVTIIGHSMGAIVTGEILQRFPDIFFDDVIFMAGASTVRDFKGKVVPYLEHQKRTRFYNLCLNEDGERQEKNPGTLDITPRGSLLVWIDTFLDNPASENDRTMGYFQNCVLATDDLPRDILARVSIKSFGRERLLSRNPDVTYTDPAEAAQHLKWVAEPMKHGDMSRFRTPAKTDVPNFAFWEPRYRDPEKKADQRRPARAPGSAAH